MCRSETGVKKVCAFYFTKMALSLTLSSNVVAHYHRHRKDVVAKIVFAFSTSEKNSILERAISTEQKERCVLDYFQSRKVMRRLLYLHQKTERKEFAGSCNSVTSFNC